ncbi:hypothetical protein RCZ04_02380 [Capnocytophaga sp. HP1101]
MAFTALTLVFTALTLVGCKSEADDGVGEKPRSSTETSFYFRDGRTHTIHMQETETRTVSIDGATNNFTYEAPAGSLGVSKSTDPTPSLFLEAYDGNTGSFDIRITDKAADGAGITATLTVVVSERSRGWDGNNFVIENIDGDKTTANAKDFVDIEIPADYTYQANSLQPDGASERVSIQATGSIIKVTAKNHYDETTPITFKLTKANAEDRVVTIKKVTKFWRTNGTTLTGLSSDVYVTKRSFDILQAPPKVPYAVKRVSGGSTISGGTQVLYLNAKITKIDLNNVETIDSWAFYGSALQTVIADKVKTISAGAFASTKLTRINLPEVEHIYGYRDQLAPHYFTFPNTMQAVIIGAKLKTLDYGLFPKEVREVRIAVTTPSQTNITFDPSNDLRYWISATAYNNNTILYVPNAYVNDWKIRFPWIEQAFKGGVRGM